MIRDGMRYVPDFMWQDMETGDLWTEDGHLVGGPSYYSREAEKEYYARMDAEYYAGMDETIVTVDPAKPGEEG